MHDGPHAPQTDTVTDAGGSHMRITFRIEPTASDVCYFVEAAASLTGVPWSLLASKFGAGDNDGEDMIVGLNQPQHKWRGRIATTML